MYLFARMHVVCIGANVSAGRAVHTAAHPADPFYKGCCMPPEAYLYVKPEFRIPKTCKYTVSRREPAETFNYTSRDDGRSRYLSRPRASSTLTNRQSLSMRDMLEAPLMMTHDVGYPHGWWPATGTGRKRTLQAYCALGRR